jgi:hypothetical protein
LLIHGEPSTTAPQLTALFEQLTGNAVRSAGRAVRSVTLTAPACCQVVELPSVHLLHIFSSTVRALTTP